MEAIVTKVEKQFKVENDNSELNTQTVAEKVI